MNTPFIVSLIINIILVLLIIGMLVYYFILSPPSSASQCPGNNNGGGQVTPTPNTNNQIIQNFPYALKTVSGRFVQSCFECLATPVTCYQHGIVASEMWNTDTVEFIQIGENKYHIKVNVQMKPNTTYYLTMESTGPGGAKSVLCLTENAQQKSTVFEIITYENNKAGNLYQIYSVDKESLIGESKPTCLVPQGLVIEDGFNLSPNVPNGMNERSFFLLFPASKAPPSPEPIAPEICEKDSDCLPNQVCFNNKCSFSLPTDNTNGNGESSEEEPKPEPPSPGPPRPEPPTPQPPRPEPPRPEPPRPEPRKPDQQTPPTPQPPQPTPQPPTPRPEPPKPQPAPNPNDQVVSPFSSKYRLNNNHKNHHSSYQTPSYYSNITMRKI